MRWCRCGAGRRACGCRAEWSGLAGKVADAFNDVMEMNERMASELGLLSQSVGKQGKISQRLSLAEMEGFWRDSVGHVNGLIDDLVHPTSETARVIGAVAQGDLSQTMALEIDGPPAAGRIPAHRHDHQHHGGPAGFLRLGSDARRARSRHRR